MPQHCENGNFYETFCCDPTTKDCFLGKCEICAGVFADTIMGVASCEKNLHVKWLPWKKVDNRWQNIQQAGTIQTLAEYIVDLALHVFKHHYVNDVQMESYRRCVSDVKKDKIINVFFKTKRQTHIGISRKCRFLQPQYGHGMR